MTALELPLRVVVTGGREYAEPPRRDLASRAEAALRACLVIAGDAGLSVAHGANPAPWGGDALGGRACARLRGLGLPIEVRGFGVDHRLDGSWPAAGNRRNSRMCAAHLPEITLGFPDPKSRGTWHCLADAAGRGSALLIDLAALRACGTPVTVARAKLRERGCHLRGEAHAGDWLAAGPLAEAVMREIAA